MSDLWWLSPGWKNARCSCGQNIWDSGGDPDWGMCYECFCESHSKAPEIHQSYPDPMCDICNEHTAVTGVNGYGVCSQECADKALDLSFMNQNHP